MLKTQDYKLKVKQDNQLKWERFLLSNKDFQSEPGSEWIIGTCVKSPCVAAGNNELTSLYR